MKKLLRLDKHNQHGFDHVLVALAFAVILALGGTYFLVATHAATPILKWKGGLNQGTNNSGFCLTPVSNTKTSKVILNSCGSSSVASQTWAQNNIRTATLMGVSNVQEFTLQNASGTTQCLNNPYGSRTNGTQLQLYTCNSNDRNNLWVWGSALTGKGLNAHQLVNVATISGTSGLCLDDAYGSHAANTKVQVWHCSGTTSTNMANQSWFEDTAPSGSTGGGGPTPASNVSCSYNLDTWSGDAAGVGYTVSKVASKDGNPASFSVKINAKKGTTEVVGYPSDQCILYSALPTNLTSTYNITPPANSAGLDYEYAYDIWLTTATAAKANNWNKDFELMIWNYNNGQEPAGTVKATLSDGSKVWVDGNNTTGMASVVLPQNKTTGTVNISSIVSQLKSLGYVSSTYDGILDVEYGIEAPYGGGQTFAVNSVSVAE